MKVEIRSGQAVIEGYVNVTERDSSLIRSPQGAFIERVRAGAFRRALARNGDVELRFNHSKHLGGTNEGSLTLREDAVGLHARAVTSDPEVISKANKKELRGWSFAFVPMENGEKWEQADERLQRRCLEDIDLQEVSILDIRPAYPATSIEMRGGELRQIEFRCGSEEVEVIVHEDAATQEQETRQADNSPAVCIQEKQLSLLKLKLRGEKKHG